MTACQQILAMSPGQDAARQLLKTLADAQGARIEAGAQLAALHQKER
jgi:hypothetical protein